MTTMHVYNATEVWQRQTNLPSIPTFSQNLDNVFGNGGLQLSCLTELLGLPGSGKTQLCLQFCASIQIPKVLGGLSAEALYIDTNTGFTITRFREILMASLEKCQRILDMPFNINEEDALNKLHYVNAFGLEKFCAFIHCLPGLLAEKPNIKLIVIDSIAFPFKEGISTKKRTGILFRQMAELQRIAVEKQIAVLVTNEMSTRIGLSSGSAVGALGDAWAHRCNKRVLLSQDQLGHRHAVLLKSHDCANTVAHFVITNEGIRDKE